MYNNVEIFALIITSIIIFGGDWSWNRPNAQHKYFAFVKQISPCKKKNGSLPFLHFNFMVLVYGRNSLSTDYSLSSRNTHTPKKMTKHIHITPPGVPFFIFSSTLQSTMTTVTICFFLFKKRKRKLKIFSAYHDKQKVNTHTHSSAR